LTKHQHVSDRQTDTYTQTYGSAVAVTTVTSRDKTMLTCGKNERSQIKH